MSVSTDGQICFGILFDEDIEFPWDDDKYDGDIEDWWLFEVLGFKHSFEMFTSDGNWIGGSKWPEEKVNNIIMKKENLKKII